MSRTQEPRRSVVSSQLFLLVLFILLGFVLSFWLGDRVLASVHLSKWNDNSIDDFRSINDTAERSLNLSYLADDLNASGLFGKVTYVEDLGRIPVREQARLYATHMFSVQPHGAGEANILFANTPDQKVGPPHITIEIANPYSDCIACKSYVPWFTYRRSAPHMMVYTISSFTSKMSCRVFCTHMRKANKDRMLTQRPFRKGIPATTVNASLITRIISDKLKSVIIPHCNGREIKAPPKNRDFHAAILEMDEQSDQYKRFIQSFKQVTDQDFPGNMSMYPSSTT